MVFLLFPCVSLPRPACRRSDVRTCKVSPIELGRLLILVQYPDRNTGTANAITTTSLMSFKACENACTDTMGCEAYTLTVSAQSLSQQRRLNRCIGSRKYRRLSTQIHLHSWRPAISESLQHRSKGILRTVSLPFCQSRVNLIVWLDFKTALQL